MRQPTRRQQLTSGLAVTLVVTVTVLVGFILAQIDRSEPRPVAEEETTPTSRSASTDVPTATIEQDEPTNVVPEVTVIKATDIAATDSPTSTAIPLATIEPTATMKPPTAVPATPRTNVNTMEPPQEVVLIPTSTGTQTPLEGACNNNQSFIHLPLNRTTLSGVVTFTGNAQTPNFSYYKLEIRKDGTSDYDSFTTFLTMDAPVWHGVLGTLDTRAFENGWYWIRLVVVDDTGNYPERCAWYYPIMN